MSKYLYKPLISHLIECIKTQMEI